MRNILLSLALITLLAAPAAVAQATGEEPVEQLTGRVWMHSTESNKLALIYGAECVISLEHYTARELAKKDPAAVTLSPFERGWSKAFKGMSRAELVKAVDMWYEKNPGQLDRPVFDVIWYELIAPKLQ